jgi:hypothetical protein
MNIDSNVYSTVFIEIAHKDGAFFEDSRRGDVCIRAPQNTQNILFGIGSNTTTTCTIGGCNLIVTNQIGVGATPPGTQLESFNVNNGNAQFNSNIYILGNVGINTTTPSEKLDLTSGNAKFGCNLYVIGSASFGTDSSNPSENVDIGSNIKVRSNAYIMHRLGVATSNPSETTEINGNIKILQNTYTLNSLSVGSSNPQEALDISLNAIVRSNAYVLNKVGIRNSNPTEELDITGKLKTSSDAYILGSIGIGTTVPSEKLDVFENSKFRSNAYILNRLSVGQNSSNPTEAIDVRGNGKVSSNLYVLCNMSVGGSSNPTEILDITGNTKISSNLYVTNRIGISTSNPTERLHVVGNIYASSNIYAFSNVGIGTVIPTERLENVGNSKLRGQLYAMNRISVFHSNPTEAIDVIGNEKISSNLYVMNSVGVRTSNPTTPLHIIGDATIEGNLNVMGIYNTISTDVKVTDQFTISNDGTGPALKVYQMGAEPIADFYDDTTLAMRIADGGDVGIKISTPTEDLDVNGNIKIRNQAYIMSNLAIGTSNPIATIHVNGTAYISGNTILSNNLNVSGETILSNTLTTFNGTTTHSNALNVSGATTLCNTLNVSGISSFTNNVAIGTSNPLQRLHVIGNTLLQTEVSSSNYQASRALNLIGQSAVMRIWRVPGTGDPSVELIYGSNSTNPILQGNYWWDFYINNANGSFNIRDRTLNRNFHGLSISSNGNVGIATIIPTSQFQVNDNPSTLTSATCVINNTIPTSTTVLNDPQNVLLLTRTGTNDQSWTAVSRFSLCRYENAGTTSQGARTRLDIDLTHDNNDTLTNVMSIRSDGNVGIGTTTPSSRLQVEGTTALNGDVNIATSSLSFGSLGRQTINLFSTTYGIGIQTSTQYFRTNRHFAWFRGGVHNDDIFNAGTEGIVDMVLSNGNLGIGTVIPAQKLDVNGTINSTAIQGPTITALSNLGMFGSNTSVWSFNNLFNRNTGGIITGDVSIVTASAPQLIIGVNNNAFGSNFRLGYVTALNQYAFGTEVGDMILRLENANKKIHMLAGIGQTVLTVTNCNVGIGTTSPTSRLQVEGTTALNGNVTIATSSSLSFGNQSRQMINLWSNNYGIGVQTSTQYFRSDSNFAWFRGGIHSNTVLNAGTGGTVDMVLNSGNLGIGTAAPASRLHVIESSNPSIIVGTSVVDGSGGRVVFGNENHGIGRGINLSTATDGNDVVVHTAGSGSVVFATFDTEQMRINPSGNVGIGTTNPSYLLDVSGQIRATNGLVLNNNTSLSFLRANGVATSFAHLDSINDVRINGGSNGQTLYINPDLNNATAINFNNSNGVFAYHGTSPRITITSAGVGVNTVSPSYTLDVNGTARTNELIVGNNGTSNIIVFGGVTGDTPFHTFIMERLYDPNNGTNITSDRSELLFAKFNDSIGASGPDRIRYVAPVHKWQVYTTAKTSGSLPVNVADSNFIDAMYITPTGNVGIGTTNPSTTLDVNGTINSTTIQGPTITALSNLGIFSSNTAIIASNVAISLSNYVYTTNTTNNSAAQTTANFASNAGVFGSNTGRFGSNTSIWASNNLFNKNTGGIINGNVSVNGNISTTTGVIECSNLVIRIDGDDAIAFDVTQGTALIRSFHIGDNLNIAGANDLSLQTFSSGWNTRIFIRNNGQVGIGTTNPSSTLHVNGDAILNSARVGNFGNVFNASFGHCNLPSSYAFMHDNTGSTFINSETNKRIDFRHNNVQQMSLSNGNLGIGTASPSQRLDIQGGNAHINNTIIGAFITSGFAGFSHCNFINSFNTNYAFLHENNGNIYINCATGSAIRFRQSNLADIMSLSNINDPTFNINTPILTIGQNYGRESNANLTNAIIRSSATNASFVNTANGIPWYGKSLNIEVGRMTGNYWGDTPNVFGGDLSLRAGSISLSGNNGAAWVRGYGGNITFYPGFASVSSSTGGNNRYVESGQTIFYHANTNGISLDTSYTEAMRISSIGNLGIGTSNPTFKLDVNGDINFTGTLRSNGVPFIGGGGSQWSNNGANVFITSSNIGIGTTSPSYLLDVNGESRINGNLILEGGTSSYHLANVVDSSNRTQTYITFGYNGSTNDWAYLRQIGGENAFMLSLDFHDDGTDAGFMIRDIQSTATPDTSNVRFIVNRGGNVGVGTATPSYLLDVNGQIRATNGLVLNNNTSLSFLRANGVATSLINFNNLNDVRLFGGSNGRDFYINPDLNNTTAINFNNSNGVFAYYGTAIKMAVTSAGVGINTASPSSTLQVEGTASISSRLTLAPVSQGAIRITGSGDVRYYCYNEGAVQEWIWGQKSSSSHNWILSTLNSGNEIDRFTVATNGNVGIGTTTPEYKLDLSNGNARLNNAVIGDPGSNPGLASFGHFLITGSNTYAFGQGTGGSTLINTSNGSIFFSMQSVNHSAFVNSNLGIRTINPSHTLDVNGSMIVRSNAIFDCPSVSLSSVPIFNIDASGVVGGRVRVQTNGNFGIGTANPTSRLQVQGTTALNGNITVSSNSSLSFTNGLRQMINLWETSFGIGIQSATQYFRTDAHFAWFRGGVHNNDTFNAGSGGTVDMVLNSGNLGIGTANPSEKLHVIGNILASGDVIGFSDIRLKSNIKIIDNALDKLTKLNGYTYNLDKSRLNNNINNTDEKRHVGLIAQEVLDVLPEAVHQNEDGIYSLAYGNMAGLFVEAIKELDNKYNKKINELQAEIATLRAIIQQ